MAWSLSEIQGPGIKETVISTLGFQDPLGHLSSKGPLTEPYYDPALQGGHVSSACSPLARIQVHGHSEKQDCWRIQSSTIVKQMTGRNRAAQLAIVKQMSRH